MVEAREENIARELAPQRAERAVGVQEDAALPTA
jgi:hypothetical protein